MAVRLAEIPWASAARHARLVSRRRRRYLGRAGILPCPGMDLEAIAVRPRLGTFRVAAGGRGSTMSGAKGSRGVPRRGSAPQVETSLALTVLATGKDAGVCGPALES